MSLNLDDWLKPSDEANEATNAVVDVGDVDEDPITNSLAAADLQLPDLGLPDIKWWVDLEFLDLASGPPANINSGQERNKNKQNPTLGNYFPDIFFDTTGQGLGSSLLNDDTHRSLIGDQTFENFEKGLLADLFPSTSGGNDDKLLEDFAEINTSSTSAPEASEEKVEDQPKIKETKEDEGTYSVPLDVLQSISKNFEKLQADFEKSSSVDENRVIRIKSIRSVPPDADIEDVIKTQDGTVATIAIQTNKANNTTTFTILPRLGQTPKQSFLVKTNNLSQATKMIRPLHLDRLPMFKNLFNNIRVEPPTGNVNKGIKKSQLAKKENIEKKVSKDTEGLISELLTELKDLEVHYDTIKVSHNHEGKLEWFCPEENCTRTYAKRSQLKLHIFSHREIKPFKCTQEGCKWSFPTIVRLQRHLKAHEGLKLFKCNLPGCEEKAFTTVYNLNAHIKDHAKEEEFKCHICQLGFKGQRPLDLHLRNSHSKDFMPSYHCGHPGCDKSYFTKTDLAKHSTSHSKIVVKNNSSLTCSTCQKTFKTKSELKVHERVHTGDRPFPCLEPGCTWSFRTSSKLRRHERSHKNDRRYTCDYCSKSYIRHEHLKEHVEIVHKNQRLACPYDDCEARFTHRHTLIAHMKKHLEDPQALQQSRYRCVIEKCGQKFQSKRNLTQHVNRAHQPELKVCSSTPQAVQDQSEFDLIALLSCVAAEDLKTSNEQEKAEELTTVDASAITPVKAESHGLIKAPNIISKSRKRKQMQKVDNAKVMKSEVIENRASTTINLQDLA